MQIAYVVHVENVALFPHWFEWTIPLLTTANEYFAPWYSFLEACVWTSLYQAMGDARLFLSLQSNSPSPLCMVRDPLKFRAHTYPKGFRNQYHISWIVDQQTGEATVTKDTGEGAAGGCYLAPTFLYSLIIDSPSYNFLMILRLLLTCRSYTFFCIVDCLFYSRKRNICFGFREFTTQFSAFFIQASRFYG